MKKLSEILLQYETDKNLGVLYGDPLHRDRLVKLNELWHPELRGLDRPVCGHCYGESYDEIFSKWVNTPSPTLLEVGVQRGASLLAWDDYFEDAQIYGVDIQDIRRDEYKRPGIEFIKSDIRDPFLRKRLSKLKFDIIIDDGSHYLPDVLHVVDNYLDLLSEGGVMVVEDCQDPDYWFYAIAERVSKDYKISTRDMRHINDKADDFLILIEKTSA